MSEHDAPFEIDEHEGELALEAGEQRLAMLLVEMDDELGIGVRAEDMAARLKLGAPLGKIEQLAIADHGDAAVLVVERLPPVLDADDREPPMCERQARREQEARIVRPAMGERRRHALDLRPVRLTPSLKINHACQAAHTPSLDTLVHTGSVEMSMGHPSTVDANAVRDGLLGLERTLSPPSRAIA
jgi:hypothetical protein